MTATVVRERQTEVATARRAIARLRASMGHQASYSPRQESILDSFEAIFLTDGFGDITIAELATRAQCSRKTVYEMAPSKERLIVLVLDRWLRRSLEQALEAMSAEDDQAAQIEAFLREASAFFVPPWAKITEDIAGLPAASRLLSEYVGLCRDLIRDLVATGIGEGLFRDLSPHLAADLIIGGALYMTSHASEAEFPTDVGAAVSDLAQAIFHGLYKTPS